MIRIVNTIKIKKGRVNEVLPRFERLHGVQEFEGFIGLEVLKSEEEKDYDEIKVCTTWEKHEDFKAWTNSDAFKARHQKRTKSKDANVDSPVIGAQLTTFEVAIQHKG